MTKQKNIAPWQIKLIHVAANELGLIDKDAHARGEEDPYRQILSGFKTAAGDKAGSCKDLNYEQADILLGTFKRLGFKIKRKGKTLKYEEFANREYKYASPKMMRKIDALWHTKSREKTDESMNKFILRLTGKNHITFLTRADASKVINAINNLKVEDAR